MTTPKQVSADQVGRTGMMITGALILGVGWFGGVALAIRPDPDPEAFVLEYVALGMAALMIGLRAIVPGVVANGQVKRILDSQPTDLREALAPVYLSRSIIAAALLEGAAFFNLVAYIITGQVSNIGMAGFLALVIAGGMPMQPKFESWVEAVQRDHM